jgi:hypothetical protein
MGIEVIAIDADLGTVALFTPEPAWEEKMTFDETVSYWTRMAVENEGFVFIVLDSISHRKQTITTADIKADVREIDPRDFL